MVKATGSCGRRCLTGAVTDRRTPAGGRTGPRQCPYGHRHKLPAKLCGRCQRRKQVGRPYGAELVDATAKPIGLQTRNRYLRAAKQFFAWLAGPERRAKEDVLKHPSRWNARTDRRHDRQDLGDAAAAALVDAARGGPMVAGVAGPDRAWLIETALETALRAAELATLVNSPDIFHTSAVQPYIVVRAAYSKHRREDHQPIRPDFARRLASYLATRGRPACPAGVSCRNRLG